MTLTRSPRPRRGSLHERVQERLRAVLDGLIRDGVVVEQGGALSAPEITEGP